MLAGCTSLKGRSEPIVTFNIVMAAGTELLYKPLKPEAEVQKGWVKPVAAAEQQHPPVSKVSNGETEPMETDLPGEAAAVAEQAAIAVAAPINAEAEEKPAHAADAAVDTSASAIPRNPPSDADAAATAAAAAQSGLPTIVAEEPITAAEPAPPLPADHIAELSATNAVEEVQPNPSAAEAVKPAMSAAEKLQPAQQITEDVPLAKRAQKTSGRKKPVPPPSHRKTRALERQKGRASPASINGSSAPAALGRQTRQGSARLAAASTDVPAVPGMVVGSEAAPVLIAMPGLADLKSAGDSSKAAAATSEAIVAPSAGGDNAAAGQESAPAGDAGAVGAGGASTDIQQPADEATQAAPKPKRKSLGLREVLSLGMTSPADNVPLFPVTWGGSAESTRSRLQANSRPAATQLAKSAGRQRGFSISKPAEAQEHAVENTSAEAKGGGEGAVEQAAKSAARRKTRQAAAAEKSGKAGQVSRRLPSLLLHHQYIWATPCYRRCI